MDITPGGVTVMCAHERRMKGPGPNDVRLEGPVTALPPAWQQFIRFCAELGHGDVERLRIQNGLPMLVEQAIKKVKFGS
jgi:hypothetical protein